MKKHLRSICPSILLLTFLLLPHPLEAGWSSFLKKILPAESTSSEEAPGNSNSTAPLAGLAEEQITKGLKEALAVGAENAIQSLGQKNGFLKNAAVKIPLPKQLQETEKALRLIGQGQRVDEFITTMNRAAETATPEASAIIGDAIRQMTVKDAQKIWKGNGDEATQYFRTVSDERLREKLLPVITEATGKTGVTQSYKELVRILGPFQQAIPAEALDLDGYVTQQTLNGLYYTIGTEEKQIRQNPTARTTDLLKKVFGAQ